MIEDLNEEELIENRKIREKMMSESNLDIFNKFKEIVFLGDDDVVIINQVADYYEVETQSIRMILQRHKDEFKEDNVKVLKDDKLKEIKSKIKGSSQLVTTLYDDLKFASVITIFPRRAVLRVGMLLRDSEIAKKIRNYLLNVESVASDKQKEWAIHREAAKMVRKEFTSDIARSGENERMKGWAYSNYTDLVYRIKYGKPAKQLKEEWGVDSIRDNVPIEDLDDIRLIERTIGGLLNTDFEYKEIKNIVKNKLSL